MRQIKFRAWDKIEKVMMKPLELSEIARLDCFLTFATKHHLLMQFTDFRDKNEKEIYESDIIRNRMGVIGIVVFEDGAFYKRFLNDDRYGNKLQLIHCLGNLDCEVIGDIYRNPELLKKGL